MWDSSSVSPGVWGLPKLPEPPAPAPELESRQPEGRREGAGADRTPGQPWVEGPWGRRGDPATRTPQAPRGRRLRPRGVRAGRLEGASHHSILGRNQGQNSSQAPPVFWGPIVCWGLETLVEARPEPRRPPCLSLPQVPQELQHLMRKSDLV